MILVQLVHRIGAHGFHAGADAHVDGAALDGVGDVGNRLQPARALAVHRRQRRRVREAR